MAGLDDISSAIGELKSDLRYAREWVDRHEDNDQKRFEALAERIDKANGYNVRIGELEAKVDEIDGVAVTVTRFKWIIVGVLAVGAIAGGAHVADFARYLFVIMQ